MDLSPAQREAVEYLGGPQIILAGAGSGKTRVIVAKAQYLIEAKGFAPDSLYIITYSRKTQAELENRMADLGENAPEVRTFHSLGMDLISEFGHFLGISSDNNKTSEHKLFQHLKKAAAELPESFLLDTNQPDSVYRDLLGFISRAKDELTSPEQIIARAERELAVIPSGEDDALILARDRWTKVLEAGKIYCNYERIKAEEGRASGNGGIDYGDMIVLAHRLLSKEKIAAATIRSRARHILVDEFQDTNYAQVEILRLMAGKACGMTVVGDDDQAIYRFRGASFASFKLFQKLFPGWSVFRLEDNYRSQAHIVKSAQALIESDQAARFDPDKKMAAARPPEANVIVRKCADDIAEAASVTREIKALLEEYTEPGSIAVLVRSRRHKDILVSLLQREGIEYHYDRKASEIKTRPAQALLALYEVSVDSLRLHLLPPLLNHFMPNLRPLLEREINYRLSRQGTDCAAALEAVAGELGSDLPSGMPELVALLRRLREMAAANEPLMFLERIISEAGLFKAAIAEGKIVWREAVAEIASLLRTADTYQAEYSGPTHAGFLDYLDWQKNWSSEGGEESRVEAPVVIQTVHGSKGLEYAVVFMIGLSNVRFPPKKMHSIVEFPAELLNEELPPGDYRIQEERRLFYVGMTRARERLFLYGVEKKGTKISRFVTELERSGGFEGVIEKILPDESVTLPSFGPRDVSLDPASALILPGNQPLETAVSDGLLELWRRESTAAQTPEEHELLMASFSSRVDEAVSRLKAGLAQSLFTPPSPAWRYQVESISYSDLSTFKNCPLQFYFRKVLRLPAPSGEQMSLGSVIHGVLEEAGRTLMKCEPLSIEALAASFEQRWQGIFFGDPDHKERLKLRGREILERFLRLQSDRAGAQPVELEKKFELNLLPELGPNSPRLIGRIDRIDAASGGFEIIDYKTGKSAEKKGDLQLPIYSLACRELLGQYALRVIYMFLGDGVLSEATFTPEELSQAKSEILEIISQINESEFTATPGYICGNCNYSRLCPASQE